MNLSLFSAVEEAESGQSATYEKAQLTPALKHWPDLERQLAWSSAPKLLCKEHTGMRISYTGLLKQARDALRHVDDGGGLAEMLRQLENHLTELGQRWYAGDTDVVDELLQLYCIEQDMRAGIKKEVDT